jgi:hypothetical protein
VRRDHPKCIGVRHRLSAAPLITYPADAVHIV